MQQLSNLPLQLVQPRLLCAFRPHLLRSTLCSGERHSPPTLLFLVCRSSLVGSLVRGCARQWVVLVVSNTSNVLRLRSCPVIDTWPEQIAAVLNACSRTMMILMMMMQRSIIDGSGRSIIHEALQNSFIQLMIEAPRVMIWCPKFSCLLCRGQCDCPASSPCNLFCASFAQRL